MLARPIDATSPFTSSSSPLRRAAALATSRPSAMLSTAIATAVPNRSTHVQKSSVGNDRLGSPDGISPSTDTPSGSDTYTTPPTSTSAISGPGSLGVYRLVNLRITIVETPTTTLASDASGMLVTISPTSVTHSPVSTEMFMIFSTCDVMISIPRPARNPTRTDFEMNRTIDPAFTSHNRISTTPVSIATPRARVPRASHRSPRRARGSRRPAARRSSRRVR